MLYLIVLKFNSYSTEYIPFYQSYYQDEFVLMQFNSEFLSYFITIFDNVRNVEGV